MIGQLQRSKACVSQNYDDLKMKLEEESKVTRKHLISLLQHSIFIRL